MTKIISMEDYKRKKATSVIETNYFYAEGRLVLSTSDRVESIYNEDGNVIEDRYLEENMKTRYFYNEDGKLTRQIDIEIDENGKEKKIEDSEIYNVYSNNYKNLVRVYPDQSTEKFEYDDNGNMIMYERFILERETRKYYYDEDNICIKQELYLDDEILPFATTEFDIIKGDNTVLIKSPEFNKFIKYDDNGNEIYYEDRILIKETKYLNGNKVKEITILKDFKLFD